MSFIGREDIYRLIEGLIQRVWKEVGGVEVAVPFPRVTYREAMETYGVDKPDRRYGMKLADFTETFRSSTFKVFQSAVAAGGVVKAFNAENQQLEKFKQENNQLLLIKNQTIRRRDLASPVSETLGIVAVCCVLYYGGSLVLNKSFTLNGPDFLTFIAIFTQIINPLKAFSTASYNIQKGAASIERIQKLIKEEQTVKENPNPISIDTFNDSIELRDVGFAYQDKIILNKINLTIKKGQTIALVGSSGAGKSTLADLIPRFHDATTGEVLIDGINIKKYALKDINNKSA
jgi:ABC-type multidrug transport system fused ATPase/permease subunit